MSKKSITQKIDAISKLLETLESRNCDLDTAVSTYSTLLKSSSDALAHLKRLNDKITILTHDDSN